MKESLADIAYDAIMQMIYDGVYKEGDMLSERELSEKLSISRTPIREALKRLSESQYIEHKKNVGAVVSTISSRKMIEQFAIRELFEKYAIEKIFDENINVDYEYLEQNIKMTEEALENQDYQSYYLNEREFHLELLRTIGNREMVEYMTKLKDMHYVALIYKKIRSRSNDSKETIKEHKTILEALKNKNKEEAMKSIVLHSERAKKSVLML